MRPAAIVSQGKNATMFKKLYHVAAWIALACLFAVGGLVGYLFASGRLNAERMDQMAMVLRGEFPKPQVAASQPVVQVEAPKTSAEELAQLQARKQFYSLISERQQRDIDDRKDLNQAIQLDVNRQLEQIEQRQQEFQKSKQQTSEQLQQTGFTQALQMYSDMEPKLAKDVLMTKKDVDVVQLFMQMESGKRKKIVNTCKTAEEKAWMGRILNAISNLDEAPPANGAPADAGARQVAQGAPEPAAPR